MLYTPNLKRLCCDNEHGGILQFRIIYIYGHLLRPYEQVKLCIAPMLIVRTNMSGKVHVDCLGTVEVGTKLFTYYCWRMKLGIA